MWIATAPSLPKYAGPPRRRSKEDEPSGGGEAPTRLWRGRGELTVVELDSCAQWNRGPTSNQPAVQNLFGKPIYNAASASLVGLGQAEVTARLRDALVRENMARKWRCKWRCKLPSTTRTGCSQSSAQTTESPSWLMRVGHPFFSKECSDRCVLFRSF